MRHLLQPTGFATGLALVALVSACGGHESSAAPSAAKPTPAKPAAETTLLPPNVEPVPTPEQAAADADKKIDAQNADAELEKLKKELEGGG